MSHTHGKQMMQSMGANHKAMGKLVQGSVSSATVHTGTQLMKNIAKHPALVFGLGLAVGFFVYKYRKEIISSTTKVVDAGKDFVLQQKETLEDIVAESQEDNA